MNVTLINNTTSANSFIFLEPQFLMMRLGKIISDVFCTPEILRCSVFYVHVLVRRHSLLIMAGNTLVFMEQRDFFEQCPWNFQHNVPYWQACFQIKVRTFGASLVAQRLRICLLMQGTRVRALVWEDPTCRGATRPVSHNY